jgi:hypothetical protein
MKKINIFIACFLIIFNIPIYSKAAEDIDYNTEMKQDILILMLAYPEYVVGVEKKKVTKKS